MPKRQLTLFGTVAKAEPLLKDEKKRNNSVYQQVVNKFWALNSHGEISKQAGQEQANKLWKAIKDDDEEIRRYLELPEPQMNTSLDAQKFPAFVSVENKSSKEKEKDPDVQCLPSSSRKTDEDKTPDKTLDAAGAFQDREKYLKEHEFQLLKYFVSKVLPKENVNQILSDDVLAAKEYTEPFTGVAYEWQKFESMRERYKRLSLVTKKTTALQKSLKEIEEQESKVGMTLKEASDVNVDKSKGAHMLALSYVKKSQLLSQAVVEMMQLKTMVTDRQMRNGLQRRLTQMVKRNDVSIKRQKGELIEVECLNGVDLTWQDALENIIELENAAVSRSNEPLDVAQLKKLWGIMSESIFLTLEEIGQFLNVTSENVCFNELAFQLLKVFPVMVISLEGKCPCVLNLHEMVLTPGAFEILLSLDEEDASSSMPPDDMQTSEEQLQPHAPQPQEEKADAKKRGRPSIIEKFPSIVNCATEFIKQHGFRAHQRRRTTTGTSLGVTIRDIKNHLYVNVEGLREHGIGDTTIRYMFQAPRKNTVAARRYQGFINAKRGKIDNSYREDHQDAHYLFARVAYRLELASMFADETAVFSCDDMNKVKVGAAAVSRYHQLSRYFEVGDSPNLPDHDFPVPGYLMIPSGYMLLEDEDKAQQSSSNAATEVTTSSPCSSLTNTIQGISPVLSKESHSSTDLNNIVLADFSEYDLTVGGSNTETTGTEVNNDAGAQAGQSNEDNQKSGKHEYKLDKLMRPHIKTPQTGSALVVARAQKFHPSTVETHVNDIYPLLKSLKEQGRSVVVLTVDGGPDWNVSFLANTLFFYRLWRKLELDMLIVCCYAAHYSAFNKIEHLWAPLSRRLAGVIFPAVLEGDSMPPARMTRLSAAEKENKEAEVFDNALEELTKVHWDGIQFDGCAVSTKFVPCKEEESQVLSGLEDSQRFLKAPLKEIESSANSSKLKEWKEMLRHLNRKANEVVFMKCTDPACTVCAGKPWQAEKMYNFLKQRNFKMFRPEESEDHPGHFATFLDLCKLPVNDIKDDDENQLSVQAKQLGRCSSCPSYSFSSKTEKKRHISMFHRRARAVVPSAARAKNHVCTFKTGEGMCGLAFSSYHKLYQHKKESGHRRKPLAEKTPASRTIAKLLQRQEARAGEDKSGGEERDEDEDDEDESDDEDEDEDEDKDKDKDEHEDEERDGNGGEGKGEGEYEVPSKKPRMDECFVGRAAKVLYDAGTPNEKWWTAIIVDRLNDSNYRLYFPDDQEVSDHSVEEFEIIEHPHQDTVVGKRVEVPYEADNGSKIMWKGIIVDALNKNKYRVFFTASQEVAEISARLIHFC